jgi:hypothetical protein
MKTKRSVSFTEVEIVALTSALLFVMENYEVGESLKSPARKLQRRTPAMVRRTQEE